MLAKLKDTELLKLVAKGDKEAYRLLVEKYQQRAFNLAYEILKSREDAEDVAQESFVKAFLSLKDFKGESSFYTWLYRIVYNMSIDYRRKIARRGGPTIEYDEGLSKPDSLDGRALNTGSVSSPFEEVNRRETAEQLRAALNELSDEHRAVVVLREIDGLSYDEIARVVGVTRGTVMSRLHYARKNLQKVLGESRQPFSETSPGQTESRQIENDGRDGNDSVGSVVSGNQKKVIGKAATQLGTSRDVVVGSVANNNNNGDVRNMTHNSGGCERC